MTRDRIERFGVARGMLAEIEAYKRESERGRSPQHIRETAVGDRRLAGLDERAITELQRLDQLRHRQILACAWGGRLLGISLQQSRPRQFAAERFPGCAKPIAHF